MTDAASCENVRLYFERLNALLNLEDVGLRRAVEKFDPDARLLAIERLKGGVSADVYSLALEQPDGNKSRVVLRLHGETHYGHNAELEFEILCALFRAGLPVARPLSVDTSCAFLEHPYLIIEFVEGTSEIAESTLEARIETMVEALSTVHSVPVSVMPSLPRRIDPIPEILEFLPANAEWHELRNYLRQLQNSAFTGPDVVLHGNYWPSNLIWSEDRIAVILDWEDAAFGDPLSDVACASLELRFIHGMEGKRLFERAYAKHRSIDADRYALWVAYVSSAALKYMGAWGLERSREEHMRQMARETLRESAAWLL
ncbi:phosphotransferase [Ruegeria sp. 2205SS24-7]|uniref:phosphotransferase family protein n=1 Tax=Ruegeria discodermiae TaxID=3064389 RepID=UPI002740D219|nr:phosphotransferase [Ruegeria sp. 2205SS24-7]MDP5220809.1 phosphotransferase [Ruegeria sp. 2205SS24-7]